MFENQNAKSTYFIQSHLETIQWHNIKAKLQMTKFTSFSDFCENK